MSTNGLLNVSGVDGNGGGSGGGGSTFPGGIDKSVQFNDGGLMFGGVSSFLYDKVSATLSVAKTKPTQIIDASNSTGTAGQVLSSTGTGLQYITPTPPTVPGLPNNSVQFNNGGVFSGNAAMIFDGGANRLIVEQIKPTVIVDKFNLIGTAGQVLSSTGTDLQYITPTPPTVPAAPPASVQFNNGGVFGGDADFTYDVAGDTLNVPGISCTGIGAGKVDTNLLEPVQIIDDLNSTGTAGQVLSSTGTGIRFITPTVVAPGAPTTSVQFNDGGVFAGDSGFTFNTTSKRLTVPAGVRTNTIFDITGGAGSINQVLTSNGITSIWQDPQYAPGAPFNSIQFNNNGVFGGSTNFVRNPSTGDVSLNARLGVGTLTAPVDIVDIVSTNATISSRSTTQISQLVLKTSDANQKQFYFQLNGSANTGDLTSIQQGVQFRPIRLNPGATIGQARVSIGTPETNAVLQLDQSLTNRKIVLFQGTNNDHQFYGFGVNSATFRYQIPSTTDSHVWFAGTATPSSTELMRLTGTGQLTVGQSATSLVTISKLGLLTGTQGYLKLGGNETGLLSNRLIGFGYNFGNNNQPAYIGYQERDNQGQTNGDLIFGTRSVTSNTVPTERMRILTNGNVGIGTATPATALQVNGTTTMTSLKTTTILDNTNAVGTAGQLLSSTGTDIQWVNPPPATVPGGINNNIQFNLAGSFGGTSNFTYTDTTSHLKVQGRLTVGSTFTTVPRIFAQSGSALFAVSSWDDQWILAGGGSGASNSAGIGMGYNNSITSGIIACCEPSTGYKPIIYSAASHDFKTNGSTRMTVTQTGGGDGLLTVPILQATQIRDGFLNTGTNGQVLTSTGIDLLWDELTPRFFFDSNATFQGTTGHRIHVSIQKKNTLYSVQVSMQRDGGIHFDLPSPGLTVGTQIIATLPVGWRPPASVDGIGYASNNNSWATQAFNWGSLNIDTSGNIRMRSPASGGPITNIQPNLEQITCSIFWLSSGTVYNSDGITR
jgi:hypothetical protein